MILQMTRPVQGGLRQEKRFNVVSNNLANAETSGFKEDILSFDRKMKATLTANQMQGPLRQTGNQLDFALEDEGYFKIQTPSGARYTRDGRFTLNTQNQLVNQNGDFVLGAGGGPILIDGDQVATDRSGNLYVDNVLVNSLSVVTFEDLTQLQKEGSGYYAYQGDGEAAEVLPANIKVTQRALEQSNVEHVTEMVQLVELGRMYETFQKMMQTLDEVDGRAINDVGKLS